RRDALPDLPPVRRPRRRPAHHSRRPEGDAPPRHARDLRPRAPRPLPHALLPVHRAVDRAGRLLRDLRRRGLPHLPLLRLAGDGRRRNGRPARLRERRRRSRGVVRLRVRLRDRARRPTALRLPGHPAPLGGGPPRPDPVLRVPVSWLRDYVAVEMPLGELAERLSVSSAEVDGVERRGVADSDGNLGLFRVGHVLEAAKHPNADRLQLCRVDVGEAEPYQIVCGAWNFGAGAKVAVALPGATLPGGLTLERRKLRGEVSEGMILAEDEVELGADHAGIMLLPDELEPGTPLADVLPLADEVLDVEPTGNRPDLFSVYGIAREVAALLDGELLPLPGVEPPRG